MVSIKTEVIKTAVEWLHELSKQRVLDKFDWQQAKAMEKKQIMRAYDIGSNEGYDLAKIDDIEEGHYMKEPIKYYNKTFKSE